MVTVYTKPGCVACDATKRKMDDLGIEYTPEDLMSSPAVLQKAREQGISSAPVVVAGDVMFGGYRPDMLRTLV